MNSPLAWLVALAGPVVVSAALIPLRDSIRTSNVSLVLVLVVVAAAVMGGRATGAVAAVVSAASFDFFFTRPYYSFTINNRDDVETAVLLIAVGLIVGELVVRARRSQVQAAASRAEVVRVRRLSELAAGGAAPGA
jgi:K+-sensing histidine kinase KdpD